MVLPIDLSSRPSETSGGIFSSSKLSLAQVIFCNLSGFLHSACAMVGMTSSGTFLVFVETSSVLSGAERHIGRSLRFRWWVVPFIRTDYICNVTSPWPGLDGGRLPPLHGVVPFIHTGYIRNVPRNGT